MKFFLFYIVATLYSFKSFSFPPHHHRGGPPPHHFHGDYSEESLPDSSVTISTDQHYRYIKSNGIPNHEPGDFPNNNNPNSIRAQEFSFKVPLNPTLANRPIKNGLSPFGIALNGVLFDPAAAEFWNNDSNSGWNYDALSGALDLGFDKQNAHVQPGGAYHYHGIPKALVSKSPKLAGYAADGFPIYILYGEIDGKVQKLESSYQLKQGTRPSGPGGKYDGTFVEDYEYVQDSGDLDECNGLFGKTKEYPDSTYYYVITEKFPNIPRCFSGTPDQSFSREAMHRGKRQHRRPPHHHRR